MNNSTFKKKTRSDQNAIDEKETIANKKKQEFVISLKKNANEQIKTKSINLFVMKVPCYIK